MAKSQYRRYAVTLEVVVTDGQRLIKAARDHAEEGGSNRGLIKTLADAVHFQLDPGSCAEDGWEIENSSVEEITEASSGHY